MPEFLRIDGIPISVDATSTSRGESRTVGSVTPAFSGGLRSSIRKEIRNWRLSTIPMDPADAELVLAQFLNGRFCVCDGELFGTGQIRECYIVATDIPYVHDGNTGHFKILSLAIQETTGEQYTG